MTNQNAPFGMQNISKEGIYSAERGGVNQGITRLRESKHRFFRVMLPL